MTRMKQELIIEVHSNGKVFIEIDSLISWFESDVSANAAYALRGMRNKALTNPNKVMTEKEYWEREKGEVND